MPNYSRASWTAITACAVSATGIIRQRLASTPHLRQCAKNPKKASAKISRIFRRFRAHGLIAKIPRTRRWRVTVYGRRVMGTAL